MLIPPGAGPGWLRIESELGRGTTVRLYLPRLGMGRHAASA